MGYIYFLRKVRRIFLTATSSSRCNYSEGEKRVGFCARREGMLLSTFSRNSPYSVINNTKRK